MVGNDLNENIFPEPEEDFSIAFPDNSIRNPILSHQLIELVISPEWFNSPFWLVAYGPIEPEEPEFSLWPFLHGKASIVP